MAYAIDTAEAIRNLQENGGFEADAARAIVHTVTMASGELATKADVDNAKIGLKADVDAAKIELKADIDAVKSELKGEIDAVKSELKGEIAGISGKINALEAEQKTNKAEIMSTLTMRFAVFLGLATAILSGIIGLLIFLLPRGTG